MEVTSKIRRRPEPLLDAPPVYASPSAFLRQVVHDMDACSRDPEYSWCMEAWVEPYPADDGNIHCAVCAGGAWIVQSTQTWRNLGDTGTVIPRLLDEGWDHAGAERILSFAGSVESLRVRNPAAAFRHWRRALVAGGFGSPPSDRLERLERQIYFRIGRRGAENDKRSPRSLARAMFGRPRHPWGADEYDEDSPRHIGAALSAAAKSLEEVGL